jgi:hypothetical protein
MKRIAAAVLMDVFFRAATSLLGQQPLCRGYDAETAD